MWINTLYLDKVFEYERLIQVIAVDLYKNYLDEDYPCYKDLSKDPDIRYMKLKLLGKICSRHLSLKETRRKRTY